MCVYTTCIRCVGYCHELLYFLLNKKMITCDGWMLSWYNALHINLGWVYISLATSKFRCRACMFNDIISFSPCKGSWSTFNSVGETETQCSVVSFDRCGALFMIPNGGCKLDLAWCMSGLNWVTEHAPLSWRTRPMKPVLRNRNC